MQIEQWDTTKEHDTNVKSGNSSSSNYNQHNNTYIFSKVRYNSFLNLLLILLPIQCLASQLEI